MIYNVNENWQQISELSGFFVNKNVNTSFLIGQGLSEPAVSDTVTLGPGEQRYLETATGNIYVKTVRGEADLAVVNFLPGKKGGEADVPGTLTNQVNQNTGDIVTHGEQLQNLTLNTMSEAKAVARYKVGEIVELRGFHSLGDGGHHTRVFSTTDDGSGILTDDTSGYLNIVTGTSINVSWFGCTGSTDESDLFTKIVSYALDKELDITFGKNRLYITKGDVFYLDGKITLDLNGSTLKMVDYIDDDSRGAVIKINGAVVKNGVIDGNYQNNSQDGHTWTNPEGELRVEYAPLRTFGVILENGGRAEDLVIKNTIRSNILFQGGASVAKNIVYENSYTDHAAYISHGTGHRLEGYHICKGFFVDHTVALHQIDEVYIDTLDIRETTYSPWLLTGDSDQLYAPDYLFFRPGDGTFPAGYNRKVKIDTLIINEENKTQDANNANKAKIIGLDYWGIDIDTLFLRKKIQPIVSQHDSGGATALDFDYCNVTIGSFNTLIENPSGHNLTSFSLLKAVRNSVYTIGSLIFRSDGTLSSDEYLARVEVDGNIDIGFLDIESPNTNLFDLSTYWGAKARLGNISPRSDYGKVTIDSSVVTNVLVSNCNIHKRALNYDFDGTAFDIRLVGSLHLDFCTGEMIELGESHLGQEIDIVWDGRVNKSTDTTNIEWGNDQKGTTPKRWSVTRLKNIGGKLREMNHFEQV